MKNNSYKIPENISIYGTAILFSIFIMPPIKVSEQLYIRYDEILIFLYPLGHFLRRPFRPYLYLTPDSQFIIKILIILFFLHAFSILMDPKISLNSFTGLLKNLKYIILFYIFYKCTSSLNINKYLKIMMILMFFISIFSILQFYNLWGVIQKITELYPVNEASLDNIASYNLFSRRVVGTFINPNVFATALIYFIILVFSRILYRQKYTDYLILSLLFITLLMTMSRMGILLVFFGLFFIILFWISTLESGRIRIITKAIIIILGLMFILVSSVSQSIGSGGSATDRWEEIARLDVGSVNSRLDNKWPVIFEQSMENPFFGHGLGDIYQLGAIDSEFLQMFYQFGIIGLMTYCILLYRIFIHARRIYKHAVLCKVDIEITYFYSWIATVIALQVPVSLYASSFAQLQIGGILWALIGMLYGTIRSKKA